MNTAMTQLNELTPPEQIIQAKSQVMSWQYRWTGRFFNGLNVVSPYLAIKWLMKLWFTPIRVKPSKRTEAFWKSADWQFEFEAAGLKHQASMWGKNNTRGVIVGVHGWRGSGYQFKHWVQPLLEEGFKVVLFDAPAHGMHAYQHPNKRQTNVLEFAECLCAIEKEVDKIDGLIAHSLGGMAATEAIHLGVNIKTTVQIAPNLDLASLVTRFCYQLNLSYSLIRTFNKRIDEYLTELFNGLDFWGHFTVEKGAQLLPSNGLLVFDKDDKETLQSEMQSLKKHWQCEYLETQGLGHFKILKDDAVIKKSVTHFSEQLD